MKDETLLSRDFLSRKSLETFLGRKSLEIFLGRKSVTLKKFR